MERELEQETVYQKAESVRVTDAYKAYELYSSIPEWKDASEKAEKCKGLIDKVDQIAATIWHNRGNRVTQDLLENFEEWKQEENRISEDIRAKSVEINGLAQTISKLSAFHAKEKRNCQEKLSSLQAQLEDLSTKQRIVKGSLQGFSSLNQVKAALQKEKETSDTLTGMGVDLNGWLTNEDAMKLLKDGAVKSQLKKRYPMLNDCDTLLPVMEFGCYPQNADGEVAPIKWLVLNEEMGKKLLVSKYALDTERFGFSEWTKSRVRTWLNDSFRSQAFTAGEQAQIVTPNENQGSVFLLSEEETREYLVSYRCKPTLYAMRKGVTADAEGFCEWWLRTPGSSSGSEMAVSGDAIMTMGFFTLRDCVGIRPAILIKAN